MTTFLVLNGVGVAFLCYVLVNFWREGRQMRRSAWKSYRLTSRFGSTHQVFVATRAIGRGTQQPDRGSIVQFRVAETRANVVGRESERLDGERPVRKYSSR
jgi:hypothetical protein